MTQPVPTVDPRVDATARSPEDLASEMDATRERLAGTLDQLLYRIRPKTILQRKIDDVKARFVDEHGQPRTDRIMSAAGTALGVVAFFAVVRTISNRRR